MNKPKVCLRCHQANDPTNNYCTRCGTPLRNICINKNCKEYQNRHFIEDRDAYCGLCGSETLYKRYGHISQPITLPKSDLPF